MICIGCRSDKNLDEFPVQKQNRSGRTGRCRICTNDQQREQKARWGRANKEKKASWQKANVGPETLKGYRQKNYYKDLEKSREVGRLNRSKYRARLRNAKGTHTTKEWLDLCQTWKYVCVYCGFKKPLTRDHAIPLSKGGSNSIDNILPACKSCNCRKSDRLDYVPICVDKERKEKYGSDSEEDDGPVVENEFAERFRR